MEKSDASKKGSSMNWRIGVGLVLLVVLTLLPGAYYYQKYRKAQDLLKNPSKVSQTEVDELVKSVSKLMRLPAGESPTVATVSDITKLQSQSFFKNAKNGDKVLIYTKAQKAIIYRPSENRIIDVAPINLNQNAQSTATSSAEQQKSLATITLLNGTKTSGLTKKYESLISANLPEFAVVEKGNAQKTDYAKSELYATRKIDKKELDKLANITGATIIDKLPDLESKPTSDIVIFLAK